MKETMKYFKPYIPYILAAVALLFAEAMLELALPGYMADIIDDGSRILLWTNDAAGIGFTLTTADKAIDLIKIAKSVASSDKPMQAKDIRSR